MKKLLFVFCFLVGLSAMSIAQTAATPQEPAKTAQEHHKKDQKACCKKGDAKSTPACCKKGHVSASAATPETPASAEQAEKPCNDAGKACCKKGAKAKSSCKKACCKSAKATTAPEAEPTPAN